MGSRVNETSQTMAHLGGSTETGAAEAYPWQLQRNFKFQLQNTLETSLFCIGSCEISQSVLMSNAQGGSSHFNE